MSTEDFPRPLTAAGARATSAHDGPPFPPDVRDEEIAQVLDAEFPIALRGYDRTAVDAYVHKVSRLISDLDASRSPQAAIRYALEQVSEQTRAILQQAHDSADATTSQSRAEAAERLDSADREATALREAAETRMRELEDEVADLWQERERMLSEMRDTAARMTEVVDAAAEQAPPAPLAFESDETEPIHERDGEDEGEDDGWIDEPPQPEPSLADAPPPLPEHAIGPVAVEDDPALGAMDEPAAPVAEESLGEPPEWEDEPADGPMRLELSDADDLDTAEHDRPR